MAHRIVEVNMDDGVGAVLYEAEDGTDTVPVPGRQAVAVSPRDNSDPFVDASD